MRKEFLLLLFLLLLNNSISAQKIYTHRVFWARLVLSDKISTKTSWELYLQKRTQNDQPGEKNMFKAPHFTNVWLWTHVVITDNLKLSVSPFGYFKSHMFNVTESDSDRPDSDEFRWTIRLETKQPLKFFNYFNRYNLEYRRRDLLSNGDYQSSWRARYMARIERPVKGLLSKDKPVIFSISNELFLQFGGAITRNQNFFDQNRITIGASYGVFRNVKFTLSYVNILQQRNSDYALDNGNCIWIVLNFDNLFSQFTAKNRKKITP